jgi:hypothetical protein
VKKESWIVFVNAGHLSIVSKTMSKSDKQALLLKANSGNDFLSDANTFLYDGYKVELSAAKVRP